VEQFRTVLIMKLHYFQVRGRGETIRLILAQTGAQYEEVAIDFAEMKKEAGTSKFPYGQAPIFEDNGLFIGQMDAITRHLARKFKLYGSNENEAALVDSFLLGVEDVRSAYLKLVYQHSFSAEGKENFLKTHVLEEGLQARNGGAHLKYLENFLKRSGSNYAVGSALSIADFALFDITDLLLRPAAFPEAVKKHYSALVAHHDHIAALPNVAAYLQSSKRPVKVNGNEFG